MPPHRPTLRDIAKATGFHFTTVGLALRGSTQLPAATVRKIRAAADRLGYRPSPLLSALSAFRSQPPRHLTEIIGYLCTYDPRTANVRSLRTFRAAAALADSMGFKLEPIRVDLSESNPARIASMLHARGTHAIILPPIVPKAGPFMDLPWEQFSVVGIGYSITNIRPHRVSFSHFQGMLLHLRKLRERGYERVGLNLTAEVNLRTGGNLLGAMLAEQHDHPRRSRIEPLIFPGANADRDLFLRWFRRARPDCIITSKPSATLDWAREEGLRVPEDVGIAAQALDGPSPPYAGIDEQDEHLGEAAVDLAASLLRADERGLPKFPRQIMVEAKWVYAPTVRALPGDEKPEE